MDAILIKDVDIKTTKILHFYALFDYIQGAHILISKFVFIPPPNITKYSLSTEHNLCRIHECNIINISSSLYLATTLSEYCKSTTSQWYDDNYNTLFIFLNIIDDWNSLLNWKYNKLEFLRGKTRQMLEHKMVDNIYRVIPSQNIIPPNIIRHHRYHLLACILMIMMVTRSPARLAPIWYQLTKTVSKWRSTGNIWNLAYWILDSLLYWDISHTHLSFEQVWQVQLKQVYWRLLYMKCAFSPKWVIPKYCLCYLNELTFNSNLFSFIELLTIFCAVFISYLMVI